MKLGTWIRLPDGREATVVFNGLCGLGIKWGLHRPDPQDFVGTAGDVLRPVPPRPSDWPWQPDAFLREPLPGLDEMLGGECVGEEYEIVGDADPVPASGQ